MSDSEEKYRNKKPPYIDDDRLLINTRLSEIERQQNEDKKYQREYDRKQLKFNKLLTIFTGLLFVTSVVSDVLIWRYVSLTKQSAEAATSAADTASKVQQQGTDSFNKTLAQMESQTEAQQVSAQAGRTSVETMRNSMQLEQRAWVIISGLTLKPMIVGQPYEIDVNIINTGRSPATIIRGIRSTLFTPNLLYSLADFNIPKSSRSPALLTPSLPYTDQIKNRNILSESEIQYINKGIIHIYFYSLIRYRDVFKVDHTTSTCSIYNYESKGFSEPPECGPFNYAN